jgi:gliding motility-associated-like protein
MQVYDRWGSLVFSSSGANPYWNGQIQGRAALPGVYMYQAQVQLEDTNRPTLPKVLQGQVTLLR